MVAKLERTNMPAPIPTNALELRGMEKRISRPSRPAALPFIPAILAILCVWSCCCAEKPQ